MHDKLERSEIRPSPLAQIFIGGVRLYQKLLSPLMVSRCRFVPSCSSYAVGAITEHGCWKGIWLAFGRLGRCHPWSQGGWDPVPAASPSHRRRTKSA